MLVDDLQQAYDEVSDLADRLDNLMDTCDDRSQEPLQVIIGDVAKLRRKIRNMAKEYGVVVI